MSPNSGDRRGGVRPHLVVLHYTAMDSCAAALERLCDPAAEVSAHYLIAEDGRLHALVAEDRRAWHAGAGAWGGCTDVNSASIGIELANAGTHPFAHRQMLALEQLLVGVMARHAIGPAGVIGHSDMAPGRKIDPGPRFDWRRLALAGLAVWPDGEAGEDTEGHDGFAADARRFGYPDAGADAVLQSFRLRFRPGAAGPHDQTDRRLMAGLARRYPAVAGGTSPLTSSADR